MAAPALPPLDTMSLPGVAADEDAARATLHVQLRHLERELSQLASDAFADPAARRPGSAAGGGQCTPRLLTFAELVTQRDDLVARVAQARARGRARRAEIEQARALLEEVRRAPERHRFVRIRRADVGEPGCGSYLVRPRLGIIGMLAGWWQVKISSGCP